MRSYCGQFGTKCFHWKYGETDKRRKHNAQVLGQLSGFIFVRALSLLYALNSYSAVLSI